MKLTDMTIEEMCFTTEKQMFDRKSARIDATAIATPMIAFANADGGLLAIGIEDNGEITGIDMHTKNINEILRAGYDFCQPSILVEKEIVECIDSKGNVNHVLLLRISPSGDIHANHRDEVFLRIGDKSKRLTFEERMELMYSKGVRFYEDEPVYRSTLDDIDMDFVAQYCKKIGYKKTPKEYIEQNKDYVVNINGRQEMSGAAILMFGKMPHRFYPRARIRFIRYEGNEAKVGAEMNVVKDKMFEGRILDLVEQTVEFLKTQIKEHTYLGPDARFVTELEYPEFVWKEIIVNAIAHRDYSIKGTDIQIKMFDDHITVESPGTLPGNVRLSNMREIHFSRNPKIAGLLHEYEYVREFGEGVDRMYREMSEAGLPEPEYKTVAFMVQVTIRNKKYLLGEKEEKLQEDSLNVAKDVAKEVVKDVVKDVVKENLVEAKVLKLLQINSKITSKEIAEKLGVTERTIQRIMKILKEKGKIERVGGRKHGYWQINV